MDITFNKLDINVSFSYYPKYKGGNEPDDPPHPEHIEELQIFFKDENITDFFYEANLIEDLEEYLINIKND
jgi:hypothetical protein